LLFLKVFFVVRRLTTSTNAVFLNFKLLSWAFGRLDRWKKLVGKFIFGYSSMKFFGLSICKFNYGLSGALSSFPLHWVFYKFVGGYQVWQNFLGSSIVVFTFAAEHSGLRFDLATYHYDILARIFTFTRVAFYRRLYYIFKIAGVFFCINALAGHANHGWFFWWFFILGHRLGKIENYGCFL